eukprot:scaffold91735_cov60-Phaeocystis_antarctica.AAC.4
MLATTTNAINPSSQCTQGTSTPRSRLATLTTLASMPVTLPDPTSRLPQHPTSAGPSHPARLLSLRSTLPTPRAPPPRAGWMYHTTLGPDQRGNTRGPP